MVGGAFFVVLGTVLGLIWQVLKIVALYYGIRLLITACSYVSSAEKNLAASGPSAEQAGEVIALLRSIEEYLEYSANQRNN